MRVFIDDGDVVLAFAPLEVPLAFKRQLRVPLDRITSAQVMPRSAVPYGPLLRAPGAHIPGLIRYGSYGTKPDRQFWAVTRADPVLVIDVTDWDYARLVVRVADPSAAAASIAAAMP